MHALDLVPPVAVVPAAGIGKRMAGMMPKQYLPLGNSTLIEQTLSRLIETQLFQRIVVVISANDNNWCKTSLSKHPLIETVIGGAQRFHSVLNGLKHIAIGNDPTHNQQTWVLVHDAARPCVPVSDIQKLVAKLSSHAIGGLLAAPVHDTMKRTNADGQVLATISREQLWRALTPQMFRLGPLTQAIEAAIDQGLAITDEASAMELMGAQPLVIEGSTENLKVTQAQDLSLAEYILNNRA